MIFSLEFLPLQYHDQDKNKKSFRIHFEHEAVILYRRCADAALIVMASTAAKASSALLKNDYIFDVLFVRRMALCGETAAMCWLRLCGNPAVLTDFKVVRGDGRER